MHISPEKTSVGFIGIGVMGKSMARHLMDAGYSMHIYTRSKHKAEELIIAGAAWHDSVVSLAAQCDVVFTILGFPSDVEAVFLGEAGLVPHMKPGATLVDMTTSSPELAKRIAEETKTAGGTALDAPVSGGDLGAREARLSIMVGGDRACYDNIMPLFEIMGKNIVYQGPAGSGQHCKMCNQITIASTMVGVCEALAYARSSGLDPATVLESISAGAAGSWSLSNLAPRILKDDFDPGFFIKHFIKDMSIAAEAAALMQLDLPGLSLAKSLYEELAAHGHGDDGTQALFKRYAGSSQ